VSSLAEPSRAPLRFEIAIVTVLALALLLPGVWNYSLIDPWETHYGEVARRMLQDHDRVHTQWQDEGFRSKPVLTFWLMAGAMKALGVAHDGGYSGELVESPITMLAIRLPFVLFGVMGLVLTWWMLARLISRRVAYLGFLVIGTCPFYALVARQGITDMTLVACMMGAVAMWLMALEVGERPA
jgi:4-amino-4-deoxy-L-arabinose transferase-like glycosyltransferase